MIAAQGCTENQLEDNYEGAIDVPLAPVTGSDERRHLPRELFVRKPVLFAAKFALAMAVIAAGWACIVYLHLWYATPVAMLVNGLMYAHLVELQHECLHGHACNSPGVNRLFGVLCGIFMLSSYFALSI